MPIWRPKLRQCVSEEAVRIEGDPVVTNGGGAVLLARERVERAIRQIARTRQSFLIYSAEFDKIRSAHIGVVPPPVNDYFYEFMDQAAFMIGAAWQAVAARNVVSEYFEVPPFENVDAWHHLRDVEEHWDDREKGKPVRARLKWEGLGLTVMPGRDFTGSTEHGLISLSRLDVDALERDLLALKEKILEFQVLENGT